jgi:hypothetical protein
MKDAPRKLGSAKFPPLEPDDIRPSQVSDAPGTGHEPGARRPDLADNGVTQLPLRLRRAGILPEVMTDLRSAFTWQVRDFRPYSVGWIRSMFGIIIIRLPLPACGNAYGGAHTRCLMNTLTE